MKKLSTKLFCAIICVAIFSCNNNEEVTIPVEKTYPDADQLLSEFKDELLSSTHGWEAILVQKFGKVYRAYIQPSQDGTVRVFADVDPETVEVSPITTYTLQVTQGINPTITFTTGSNLDKIPGVGKSSGVDKEYSFKSHGADTLYLEGNTNGDLLKLTRANESTAQLYEGGAIKQTMSSLLSYLPTTRVLYFQPTPETKIQFVLRSNLRSSYFTYVENNVAHFFGSDFIYSEDGVKLKTAVDILGVHIEEILWDNDLEKLYVMHNGTRLYVSTSSLPVVPLHNLLGNEFSPVTFVEYGTFSRPIGWSYKFEREWNFLDYDIHVKGGTLGLNLYAFLIDLDVEASKMNLIVYNVDVRNRLFVGKFPFKFTKSNDGVFDFEPLPIDTSTPEGAYAADYSVACKRLTDLMSNHRFKINFYNYSGPYKPEFQSVEDPEMYFVGDFY